MKLSERLEALLTRMTNGHVIALQCMEFIRDHGPALAELARRVEWQPIETAPRDGTRILAMIRWSWSDGTDGEAQDVIYWHARAQFWVCGTPMNYVQVLDEGVAPTHWRPLPAPPAIDQARGKAGQEVGT